MTRCIDCGGEIIEGEDHHCHTTIVAEQALSIGDTVYFAYTHDERDRPIITGPTPLTIVHVGNGSQSFDYEVESPSGNRFFVKRTEITERR